MYLGLAFVLACNAIHESGIFDIQIKKNTLMTQYQIIK
jgi:hypothetical protein